MIRLKMNPLTEPATLRRPAWCVVRWVDRRVGVRVSFPVAFQPTMVEAR